MACRLGGGLHRPRDRLCASDSGLLTGTQSGGWPAPQSRTAAPGSADREGRRPRGRVAVRWPQAVEGAGEAPLAIPWTEQPRRSHGRSNVLLQPAAMELCLLGDTPHQLAVNRVEDAASAAGPRREGPIARRGRQPGDRHRQLPRPLPAVQAQPAHAAWRAAGQGSGAGVRPGRATRTCSRRRWSGDRGERCFEMAASSPARD